MIMHIHLGKSELIPTRQYVARQTTDILEHYVCNELTNIALHIINVYL